MHENYPESLKRFISHIKSEYDIDNSSDGWSLVKVLQNGFGMHHCKLPKYIQKEILEQFNAGAFNILFCTSTIVEGVNTDAQNMIILNASKGRQKLTPFDIKNIKGRAGRYYHCFVGRVFYMSKELQDIENSDALSLNFITYSDKELGPIDIDNADINDLTSENKNRKIARDEEIKNFMLPQAVFEKNRTVSKENQEKLLRELSKTEQYSKFYGLIHHSIDVERFLQYGWIKKIIDLFCDAGLIDSATGKRYIAILISYYKNGFKGILKYEIEQHKNKKISTIDDAYSEAFKSVRDIVEHKIPKILSLFESALIYVAETNGDSMEGFSLSRVRRYYETGVKSLVGEALIEYGFPTDAIRLMEEKFDALLNMSVSETKKYCRKYYFDIINQMDSYERDLFTNAMRTLKE